METKLNARDYILTHYNPQTLTAKFGGAGILDLAELCESYMESALSAQGSTWRITEPPNDSTIFIAEIKYQFTGHDVTEHIVCYLDGDDLMSEAGDDIGWTKESIVRWCELPSKIESSHAPEGAFSKISEVFLDEHAQKYFTVEEKVEAIIKFRELTDKRIEELEHSEVELISKLKAKLPAPEGMGRDGAHEAAVEVIKYFEKHCGYFSPEFQGLAVEEIIRRHPLAHPTSESGHSCHVTEEGKQTEPCDACAREKAESGRVEASQEEKANGWTLSHEYLVKIARDPRVIAEGGDSSMELIEAIVLASHSQPSVKEKL